MRWSVAILLAVSAPLLAQVAVINPLVVQPTMSASRMTDMLLGRVTTWGDGSPVVLVLVEDADADAHLNKFVGRPRERLLRAWKRLVFNGSGSMPLEAANASAALDLVARTPGAVALMATAADDPRWRVVSLSAKP